MLPKIHLTSTFFFRATVAEGSVAVLPEHRAVLLPVSTLVNACLCTIAPSQGSRSPFSCSSSSLQNSAFKASIFGGAQGTCPFCITSALMRGARATRLGCLSPVYPILQVHITTLLCSKPQNGRASDFTNIPGYPGYRWVSGDDERHRGIGHTPARQRSRKRSECVFGPCSGFRTSRNSTCARFPGAVHNIRLQQLQGEKAGRTVGKR
ncbi:hypothetical protein P389DRAFT_25965 [Cystobasidium minutum MCA 4210]|uniref:uncharacterized protein n=1 Tax=Cystobasidium minutum MCA 4210 TaxID=1397322 RepID=UPI0034CD618A|eukprot:jgi/Rhomi1/25965/CE25964_735